MLSAWHRFEPGFEPGLKPGFMRGFQASWQRFAATVRRMARRTGLKALPGMFAAYHGAGPLPTPAP